MKHLMAILIVLFATLLPAEAQILERVARSAKDQAKRTTEKRATDEVNKEVDKGVNRLFDNVLKELEEESDSTSEVATAPVKQQVTSQNADEERASRLLRSLGVDTTPIELEENFRFNTEVVMETESTDEVGKKQSGEMKVLTNSNNQNVAMVITDGKNISTTLFDNENGVFAILSDTDGEKTGFATKLDPNSIQQSLETLPSIPYAYDEEDFDEDECMPKRTGRTQRISGFSCEEYKCETPEETTVVWLTKDLKISDDKLFGSMAWGSVKMDGGFEGVPIKFEVHSKTDKSSSITTITSISDNKTNSLSTKGYEISSMSISLDNK